MCEMEIKVWEWSGMDEILDIGSSTHVAFKWVWFGKTLDVGSSVFYSFERKSFFIVLNLSYQLTCKGKEYRKGK